MSIRIEQAELKDLNYILALNHKLFLYEATFTDSYDVNWPFSDKGNKYFSDRIEDLENSVVLVAKNEHQVIGYICGHLDNYSFRTLNPITEIENMFVEEDFRGKYVGKRLFEQFLQISKSKGTKVIKVTAFLRNENAIKFYKKCGFYETDVTLELEI